VPEDDGEQLGEYRNRVQEGFHMNLMKEMKECLSEGVVPEEMGRQNDPTVFVLMLESRPNLLEIVGTETQHGGAAPSWLVGCLSRTMAKKTFAAPGIEPGNRYRVRYPVGL
jgi:hypothetical protein